MELRPVDVVVISDVHLGIYGCRAKACLIATPIKGQYEQCCNAAALIKLGVTTIDKVDENFHSTFADWIKVPGIRSVLFPHTTELIIDFVMSRSKK